MKLNKKKELAARTLNVGKERILFNTQRLEDIKEAITKQDIKDLNADGAILIKKIKGRKVIIKRKTRRRAGSRKKKVSSSKQKYVKLTRKLRSYMSFLKNQNKISQEDFIKLRKEIKASYFKSLSQMKERIMEMRK